MTTRDGIKSIATGNWGCGSRYNGNVQLKLVIQWMAASVAGLPVLVYHTAGHEKLAKVSEMHTTPRNISLDSLSIFSISCSLVQLDTVCRVLLDRKWTVGELAAATLEYAKDILDDEDTTHSTTSNAESRCLFEKLIGI